MNPANLDTGSREASSTQADEVGHFYITSSYEEGYDHYHDGNLAVVSDAAAENGQTDNINPAGNPNCDVDICQDDVETASEETTPKTALDNGTVITTTLSGCYNAPENSVHTSAEVVGNTSHISDTPHPSIGLYENQSCEQDTRNPNHVYTQNDIGLNPMYVVYQQDTQDPNPMYVPKTGQDYSQSTAKISENEEEETDMGLYSNVMSGVTETTTTNVKPNEPASGLANNDDCNIRPCAPTHHYSLADDRDDNILPSPPNPFIAQNVLIRNPTYVPHVQPQKTCVFKWFTYRRLLLIVMAIGFLAALGFCVTSAGLYFNTNLQDVTTGIGTTNYGPADEFTCCSTNFSGNEGYYQTLKLTTGTFNQSAIEEEPTSTPYNFQNATLPSIFSSSYLTPIRTRNPKTMPTTLTKIPSSLTTAPSGTTRPESKVSTKSLFTPTSTLNKERHTETIKSENLKTNGKVANIGTVFNGFQANGVAVSKDNEVYLADTGNKLVNVFSVKGVFLRDFKTVVPGTNGQKMFPVDIATDRNDHLWAVGVVGSFESGIAHIVRYNREGLPQTTFGLPGKSTIEARSLGIAADKLNDRIIVITNWVHIHIFHPNGRLIRVFRRVGSTKSPIGRPYIATGKEGNIIVSVEFKKVVQVYTKDGHWLFGLKIGSPRGVCTDSSGNIIVANWGKNRVDIFISRNEYTHTGPIRRPDRVAIATDGRLLVTSKRRHHISINMYCVTTQPNTVVNMPKMSVAMQEVASSSPVVHTGKIWSQRKQDGGRQRNTAPGTGPSSVKPCSASRPRKKGLLSMHAKKRYALVLFSGLLLLLFYYGGVRLLGATSASARRSGGAWAPAPHGGGRSPAKLGAARSYLRSFADSDDQEAADLHAESPRRRRMARSALYRNAKCRMDTCWDFSRCPPHKPFRVYIHPNAEYTDNTLGPGPQSAAYTKILEALRRSGYLAERPEDACVLVLAVDTLDRDRLSPDYVSGAAQRIQALPLWNGDGTNHLVFNIYSGTWPDYAEELGFDTGRAVLAKASFSMDKFRPGFDISIPLFAKDHPQRGGRPGDLTANTFPAATANKYLLVFKGKRYLTGIGSETRNALYHLHNGDDIILTTTCKHGKSWKSHDDGRCQQDQQEFDK
ncbi:hypothetical protein Bbelb_197850 [Branchiostoma belcheri]|nr:hypothetical protein Bbelb_197850 [Branchiostoma belcheri]